jgi:putative tricarboxylic transport membrane protein
VKEKITFRSMLPSRAEFKTTIMPMLRGSAVGSFFGALPGTGGSISSFMATRSRKK